MKKVCSILKAVGMVCAVVGGIAGAIGEAPEMLDSIKECRRSKDDKINLDGAMIVITEEVNEVNEEINE